jgi:hypothetical protein
MVPSMRYRALVGDHYMFGRSDDSAVDTGGGVVRAVNWEHPSAAITTI